MVSLGFPAIRAVAMSVESTLTGTHTINIPPGVPGDLIAAIAARYSTSTTTTPPVGWTRSGNNDLSVMWKVADGSEGDTAVWTSAARRSVTVCYRLYRGTFNPLDPVATATTKTLDPPNLAPGWGAGNILWITAATAWETSGNADLIPPSGYTNPVGDSTQGGAGNNSEGRMVTARRPLNAASENPGAWTAVDPTPSFLTALTVAIQPAAL